MSELKDKRVAPREPVHLVAEVELNGEQIGCAISRDASGTGLLLLSHLKLLPGTEIVLGLHLPHEGAARRLPASVVRCELIPASEGIVWDYRIAVALDHPPPDLQQLVRSLSKRSSMPPPPV